MALNRTSDSLSRCDPNLYSNIYDVRKRPDIKNHPVSASQPIHKDTIEISHDKLKEEALQRLRHTSKFVIAQNSFMRIGKTLFLAVAFPPYLLLYGLPKWILVEGIPAVFSLLITVWKNIKGKAKERLEKGRHSTVQLVQFTRSIGNVLIQPVVRLYLEFRNSIRRLADRGHHIFKRLQTKARDAFSIPRKKMANGIEGMHKGIVQLKEKVKQKTEQFVNQLQDGIQWIKQAPMNLLSWARGQLQWMKDQAVLKNTPLAQRWRASQQIAQKATEWVSKQFLKGAERIKRNFEPVAALYREQMLPIFKGVKLAIQTKWKQAGDFLHRKHQQAQAFLDKKQAWLKQLSTHDLMQNIMSQTWLPNWLKVRIQKWLAHPLVKALSKGAIKTYAFMVGTLLSTSRLILQALSRIATLLSKMCNQLRYYASIVGTKGSAVLDAMVRICRKALLYILYYGILYIMIAAIALAWGIRSIGKLLNSFKIRDLLRS